MSTGTFTRQQAGVTMTLHVEQQGQDILVTLVGGDVPHFGVVTTVGQDGVFTHALPSRPGHVHQEGALTQRLAKQIAPVLAGNAIITAGMHVNEITKVQMQAAFALTKALGDDLRHWLQAHPVAAVVEKFAK